MTLHSFAHVYDIDFSNPQFALGNCKLYPSVHQARKKGKKAVNKMTVLSRYLATILAGVCHLTIIFLAYQTVKKMFSFIRK